MARVTADSRTSSWSEAAAGGRSGAGNWIDRIQADASCTPLALGLLLLFAALAGTAVALTEANALLVGVSLLAWVFILLDFRIGVLILIVLMPLSASTLLPRNVGGITGLNPLNLLLIGTLLACLLRPGKTSADYQMVPPQLVGRYVLPIVVAALIGMGHVDAIPSYFHDAALIAYDSAGSYLRDMLVKPMFMVLFAVLVGAAVARSERFETFLMPMLMSVWAMGLMTVVFVAISGVSLSALASSEARTFLSPLGMHANDLGRCYAIAYALMLFTFAASRNFRLRLLLLASMGMVVVALVLTFSRGAFAGFIVVNILFLIAQRRFFPLLIGAVLLVGMVFMLPEAVFQRLSTGVGGNLNAVTAGRTGDIWLPLIPEILDSPIIGHGLGSILWTDAMRSGRILTVTHPHNAYLQALLDTGVVGLILMLSFFGWAWRRFRALASNPRLAPERRGFYAGAAAGLMAFLITGFAGSSLMPVAEQSLLWLAFGMMWGESTHAGLTGETHHG